MIDYYIFSWKGEFSLNLCHSRKRRILTFFYLILLVSSFASYSVVTHKIQQNETLFSISIKYNVSISTILDWNPGISPNSLRVGQSLKIPQPDGYLYEVKKGDTLSSIAKLFFADVEDIKKINGLTSSTIVPGQKIFIPNSAIGKGFNNERSIIWPTYGTISSLYGYRVNPISKEYALHKGVDIAAPTGTPIFASEDGVVEFVGENNGYGLMIQIDSNSNTFIYGHLSQINVYKGQYVKKGQLIGRVGSTGDSTGPHLHFEVRREDKLYDPLVLLPSRNNIYVLDERESVYGVGGE